MFKKFRDDWKTINPAAIQSYTDIVTQHFGNTIIKELLIFYNQELQKNIVRDDYREVIELSIIFLGGDNEKKIKIRPPGSWRCIKQGGWLELFTL